MSQHFRCISLSTLRRANAIADIPELLRQRFRQFITYAQQTDQALTFEAEIQQGLPPFFTALQRIVFDGPYLFGIFAYGQTMAGANAALTVSIMLNNIFLK